MWFRLRWSVMALGLLAGLAACAPGTANRAAAPPATPVLVALPTATPIPTPTDPAGQALEHVATAAVGTAAQSVGVSYDVIARNLKITVTITGVVPATDTQVAAAWKRAQNLTLQEMTRVWASGQPLAQVTVIVMGPAQDEYDAIFPQAYSVAMVDAATAGHIDWASVTADGAWPLYDQTYLRPSFTVADDVVTGPVTTTTPGQG